MIAYSPLSPGFNLSLQLFIKQNEDPPIANNLPPVAGALTWSRGLLERVSLPMSKITEFDNKVRSQLQVHAGYGDP